jgi:hypothetical protein
VYKLFLVPLSKRGLRAGENRVSENITGIFQPKEVNYS